MKKVNHATSIDAPLWYKIWRLSGYNPTRAKEDKAAKELLDEVQNRKQQLEDEIWKEVEEYIISWKLERRISSILTAQIMTNGTMQYHKSGELGE